MSSIVSLNNAEDGSRSGKGAVIVGTFFVVGITAIVLTLAYRRCERMVSDPNNPSNTQRVSCLPESQPLPDGFEIMEGSLKPIRFLYSQLFAFKENFSRVLGSGAYGVVYKGQLPNGCAVAVKVLKNTASMSMIEAQFMAEVSSIGRTHHINLVRLYGFCFDPVMRALVFEYMDNGSLENLLFKREIPVELEKLQDIAIGIAKGIAYLHEECQHRIVHYDIKAGNILLDENLNPKVADFGLAKLCNRGSTEVLMTGFRGTPGYAAPELYAPYPVTFKCDVYSFGILLFEIVGRRKHFEVNQPESRQWLPRWAWDMLEMNELPSMVALLGVEEKDTELTERMIKVAFLCIEYSPHKRPLMSSVVKMLEGGMDIPSVRYPFKSVDLAKPSSSTETGSSFDTNASTIRTVYTEGSCSKTNGETLEIVVCS